MVKNLLICFITMLLVSCGSSSQRKSDIGESDTQESSTTVEPTEKAEDYQFLVKVGDIAPDFEMQMPDGSIVNLSSLRGKVVMLQFTASWCGVCRKEMPYIESRIWQRHKDNPEFELFGIDREEPVEKIEELIKATKVTYPIGLDPEADIFSLYAEPDAGITRNVIIDRDGKIIMLTRLFEEEEFNRLVEIIDQSLQNTL
ncbi:MAG: TlpA disulfide reductase family protein [Fermentimonas sp.]|jgi:peroxiredoxin|nr:TlpA disulfide reductase family protein [Fermentimonas sp.]NLC85771.1 TlpA family protein disulfide reductase [Bacteroidales bacterium]HBT85602.1 redoxin [Porphyromonadaceae bacterium]MDD2930107.1 TlpA disulfide reductase family protein [Fermentimonas sp.]MDD3187914.1 TlpA disulfide reductase family protein [Fermentimonas sp.]